MTRWNFSFWAGQTPKYLFFITHHFTGYPPIYRLFQHLLSQQHRNSLVECFQSSWNFTGQAARWIKSRSRILLDVKSTSSEGAEIAAKYEPVATHDILQRAFLEGRLYFYIHRDIGCFVFYSPAHGPQSRHTPQTSQSIGRVLGATHWPHSLIFHFVSSGWNFHRPQKILLSWSSKCKYLYIHWTLWHNKIMCAKKL